MTDSLESRGIAYQVYVMRFWQEQIDSPVWRISLEDPNTGQRRGFACLSELTAYLENATSLQPPKDEQLQAYTLNIRSHQS